MSEFKVGDRVITKWGKEAYLTEIYNDECRLNGYGIWWYPLSNMTKINDAPEVKDDGGPAFPIGIGDMRDPQGMSLRDYFAAKAMQGDWAAQDAGNELVQGGYYTDNTTLEFMVQRAELYYRMADAMLEARKK